MRLIVAGSFIALVTGLTIATVSPESKPKTVKNPTYAEHVAPLLNARCVECHRPGEVGPFSLVGYENAKKRSAMIAAVTESRQMPPWKAVEGYGEFHDENRLTREEISLLVTWAKNGAPRGDAKKEPKSPEFSGEWSLGQPDKVISASKPFKLGAEGEDVYRNFVIDPGLTETKYVTAIDVKPGNAKVVHHVIAFLDPSDQGQKLAAKQNDGQEGYSSSGGGVGFIPRGALGGWAPGVRARFLPDGIGYKLAPGTKIIMQVHYHKSGKEETDLTRVGLYFADKPVAKECSIFWAANPIFRIPAGADKHRVRWDTPIPADITAYWVMPHMHLLGKSMKAWIKKKDGSEVPLVHVDSWDFNWQLVYSLRAPLKVEKGSTLCVEAYYDNSTGNPNNPSNPPKAVSWGEETTDEMALLVLNYTRGW